MARARCGESPPWYLEDIAERLLGARWRGTMEHLVIQLDFMLQVARRPRTEWSIPHASKSVLRQVVGGPGTRVPEPREDAATGFADVVSLRTGEIWEIKPLRLVATAVMEAQFYAKAARRFCPGPWTAGNSYTTSAAAQAKYGAGSDVVWRLPGGKVKVELHAAQRGPGAIAYWWTFDGRREERYEEMTPSMVYPEIVKDLLPARQRVAAGSSPGPGGTTMVEWGMPQLEEFGLDPAARPLWKFLNALVRREFGQVPDGGAVEVRIERTVYERLATQQREQAERSSRSPSVLSPYKVASGSETSDAVLIGFVAAAVVIVLLAPEVALIAGAAEAGSAGTVVGALGLGTAAAELGTAEAVTASIAPVVRLAPAAARAVAPKIGIAAAASGLFLGYPRDVNAANPVLDPFDASPVTLVFLNPAEVATYRPQTGRDPDGSGWVVVGLAHPTFPGAPGH